MKRRVQQFFFFYPFAVCILTSLNVVGQTTSLLVSDLRNDPTTPSSYNRSFQPHFKFGSAIGLPEVGNPYYFLLGFRSWYADNSGGKAHELAFSNNYKIYFRSGNSPNWESWRELIISDSNGNVGIGIDNPTDKLAVNGSIRAKEIKVETANWPDYVFKKDYPLLPLEDVDAYIKENGRLPGIPAAAEVEANGVALAEMNRKLLEKVEELTLYLIELNESNRQIKEKNKWLENSMNELKTQIIQRKTVHDRFSVSNKLDVLP
ncbi:hypothetical protein ACFOET_06720 [Parapedobacter deserti]|uniref:Uncharacterized protein n=1 Tax=Parapedobacter deserti TaxID=1912957 RepID=A0ABV7JH07_9SPHI